MKTKISKDVLKALNDARKLLKGGDIEQWDEKIQKLYMSAPNNEELALVLAHEYQEANHNEKAITLLQTYVSFGTVTPRILMLIASLAMSLELYEIATKVCVQLTEIQPTEAGHYVNIAECLKKQNEEKEALQFILQVLPSFQAVASVWRIFAELLEINYSGEKSHDQFLYNDCLRAVPFKPHSDQQPYPLHRLIIAVYDKVIELDPKDFNALNNYANFLGMVPDAVSLYEAALKINRHHPQPNIGLAIHYLANGRLREAWPHYEYRKKEGQGASKIFNLETNIPEWDGNTNKNKSLLICAEQGLGDEVLFFLNIKHMAASMRKLYVGCDPRLVSILKRSFPDCIIAPYKDEVRYGKRIRSIPELESHIENGSIDYKVLSGSIPQYIWPNIASIPDVTNGFLKADTNYTLKGIDKLDPSKLTIGISWRSGNVSEGRNAGYWGIESVKTMLELIDAQFINLQYDYTDEELKNLSEYANFLNLDSVNLRQDLEANLAIMQKCDVVIGPPTATQMLSFALGKDTLIPSRGVPWYTFGKNGIAQLPYARHVTVYEVQHGDMAHWNSVIGRLYDKINRDYCAKMHKQPKHATQPQNTPNNNIIAFFTMGLSSHPHFLKAAQWTHRNTLGELIILNEYHEKIALEKNQVYWPQLPLEDKKKARILYGGQVTEANTETLSTCAQVKFVTFFKTVEASIASQYNHYIQNAEGDVENVNVFVERNKRLVSQAYRILNDFTGLDANIADRVFDPEYTEEMFDIITGILDKFYFIGFCEETYEADIELLCSSIGLERQKHISNAIDSSLILTEKLPENQTYIPNGLLNMDHKVYSYIASKRQKQDGPINTS